MTNLNSIMNKMDKSQNQLASGKTINKPSDNPTGAARSMQLNTDLVETEQYTINVDYSISWTETAESAFSNSTDIMQRARELAVQGANMGVYTQDSLDAIADEIEQLRQQMIVLGNASNGGRYVFGGAATINPPFEDKYPPVDVYLSIPPTAAEVTQYIGYNGDNSKIYVQVGAGVNIDINVPGGEPFASNIAALTNLRNALRNGDADKIDKSLTDMDKAMEANLTVRSDLGARSNRLELVKSRLEELGLNYNKLLSNNEDTDMAEVIMNLKMQENVQKSALSVGAKIITPSLVDFLR